MKYWTTVFSATTWEEFKQAGANICGYSDMPNITGRVNKVGVGDTILAYVKGDGVSCYIGIFNIEGKPYRDSARIWSDGIYPWRVKVKAQFYLELATSRPIHEILPMLSWYRNMEHQTKWGGRFQGVLIEETKEDAQIIIEALNEARETPTYRGIEQRTLERTDKSGQGKSKQSQSSKPDYPEPPTKKPSEVLRGIWSSEKITGRGQTSRPDTTSENASPSRLSPVVGQNSVGSLEQSSTAEEESTHEQIQRLLAKLGSDMGLGVWIALNDAAKFRSDRGSELIPNLRSSLPRLLDDGPQRMVELIDVLWLRQNTIVGAFEIEHTTSVHSGLLRMSDLIALQPNINIPLYIVAPDERRGKVSFEIQRPTFSRLTPPLSRICRFIPYSALIQTVERVGNLARRLSPDFLTDISESFDNGL